MLKIKVDRLLFVLLIFLIIYNPPIGPIKALLVLFPISSVYILLNFNYIKSNFKSIINGYVLWLFLFLYVLLVALCNDNSPAFLQSFIYILAAVIPSSIMVTALMRKSKRDFRYFIDTILYSGLIQCFVSLMSFFDNNVKNILVRLMINGRVFQEDTYSAYMQNIRLFGFSTGLTFGMPAVQAFLAIVSLYLAISNKYSKKYYIMIPLFSFSGIVNARSSLIIMGIGIVALLFAFPQNKVEKGLNRCFKIFMIIILALISTVAGVHVLKTISPTTYIWIEEGFLQIVMLFYGDTSFGYFSYLVDSDRWVLPSGLGFLFGYGIRVLGPNPTNVTTDIGYVNDIYFGGIVYSAILYLLMLKYILSFRRFEENKYPGFNKFLLLFFLASFIVLNFKGYIFDLNNFFVLFIIIAVFISSRVSCQLKTKTRIE